MMRSMFSGISGLRAHQTMMDVVGNNIANVNTAGFKGSAVTFQEAMTQTVSSATGADVDSGSTNPLQVGLGVQVGTVDGIFTQGSAQATGRPTDVMIQGEGFFVTESNGERLYTRAGNFNFDEIGNLVAPGGRTVLGWLADDSGAVNFNTAATAIRLPLAEVISPQTSTLVEIGGNLPADAVDGTDVVTSITVYDSLGNPHDLVVTFTKVTDNEWDVAAELGGDTATLDITTVTFNADGSLATPAAGTPLGLTGVTPAGADPLDLDLYLDAGAQLVQYGGVGSVTAVNQDGNPGGFIESFGIAEDGSVIGRFTNGSSKVMANIATAYFNNPAGLNRVGDSNFASSASSGQPVIGLPGEGGRGMIQSGMLEMSNVELAQEFTNLIIAQRGFQANSRIITASDEVLADLVNMKR